MTNWNYDMFGTQKGWECPRCGQINAPWMPYCICKKSVTFSWVKDTSTTSKPTTETIEESDKSLTGNATWRNPR